MMSQQCVFRPCSLQASDGGFIGGAFDFATTAIEIASSPSLSPERDRHGREPEIHLTYLFTVCIMAMFLLAVWKNIFK